MKKALVTGGAGFLGSHLCERLLGEGYEVVAVDNLYTGTRENLTAFAANPGFTFVEADVTELAPGDLTGPFDEVYALACPASPAHYQAHPIFTTLTSIQGVLLCLDIARRDGARLLHASTSEIYGDPLVHPQEEHNWGNVNTIGIRSCYDEGKRCAESLCFVYQETDIDLGVKVDGSFIESDDNLFCSVETHSLTLDTRSCLCNIVQTEDHIL